MTSPPDPLPSTRRRDRRTQFQHDLRRHRFFAQWFTDSFLRTDFADKRKNTSNHEIDLCQIYGLNEATARILREGRGGRLRTQTLPTGVFPPRLFDADGAIPPEFEKLSYVVPDQDGQRVIDWILPQAFGQRLPPAELERRQRALYATGLERGSNTVLYAALNAVFIREHNRICGRLADAHPDWDDDRLFETARNINIVQALKLVVEEYINHLAGLPLKFRLDCTFAEKENWYRTNRIAIEFNLLYRWHSLIPDALQLDGVTLDDTEYRFNNTRFEELGVEPLIAAASRQPAGRVGLRNSPRFLDEAEKAALQFARDFRLQSFNAYRERFGLRPYTSYANLTSDAELAAQLEGLYGPSVDRLEFVVGLFAEKHDRGSSFGELLRTMVAVDAFSQVFTSPLLSTQCYGQVAAFGSTGIRIVEETTGLQDIVARNAPPGTEVLARFHLWRRSGDCGDPRCFASVDVCWINSRETPRFTTDP